MRRPVDQLDLPTSWLTLAHAALAAGGLAIATTIPAPRILWFPILSLLASSLLFFGYVRLGVAYAPILWVLQAMAIARLLRGVRVADPWPRRAEFGAAALALALLLAERSVVQQPRVLSIDGLVDDDGRLVEDQRIEITRIR